LITFLIPVILEQLSELAIGLEFIIFLITNDSVEYLNPKVVRSSMGSLFHLNIYDEVFENDLLNLKNNGYQINLL
jgi:tRNA G18 (ribose-2'-O)-methylase SpoU